MIHFVGDMHQPLHDEDNGDQGGNTRHVIFHGHPDNLHWVWHTGLLQHINRNPAALAAELESRITPQDKAEWQKGSIEDWVMEGHRLAQRVAYGDLSNENPAPITAAYERQADPVIELQLEKAGVRLAYLLDANLMPNAAADLKTASLRVEPLGLMVIVGNQGGLTPVGVKAHGVAGVPQRKAERSAVAAGKLLAGKK